MGFINPFIYGLYSTFAKDITSGDNKCTAAYKGNYTANPPYAIATCCKEGFTAGVGWDPTTGVGVPDFDKMLAAALNYNIGSSSSSAGLSAGFIAAIVVCSVIGFSSAVFMIYFHVNKKPTYPMTAKEETGAGSAETNQVEIRVARHVSV
jgi:hypothetical protein